MTDNLEIHKVKERIKMTNMKQTQDDRTIQPFNRSTIQRVKAYAFTLAETLIVIGIIGVVAALTLPNLNHATGDKEKVTKVKKVYASLTDAVDRAQVIYGPFDTWFKDCEWGAECSERFAKRITEFMKVSKDCGFDGGCFSSAPVLDIDGDKYNENDLEDMQALSIYMVTLSDGISLGFCHNDIINVDIDGPNKGKNQDGNDRFNFQVGGEGENSRLCPSTCGSEAALNNSYLVHTLWTIRNDNLDYLKCPDELKWDTQTSCK